MDIVLVPGLFTAEKLSIVKTDDQTKMEENELFAIVDILGVQERHCR